MATETSVDTYTGIYGVISYNGNPLAYVKANVEISRDAVKVPRGGKYSDLSLPGKVSVKGKIQYGLVDGQMFVDALDDGSNTTTTSDEALHAAIAGTGAEVLTNSVLTNPSTPMTVKLKIISSDGYSAGAVVINGTDVNDDPVSESIPFPTVATGSTTTYYYGSQQFKTIVSIVTPAVLSANDNVTPYGAAQKTVTLGDPKLFTLILKAYKSATQYTEITMTNVWLSKLPLELGSASDAILPEMDFEVRDPDADLQLVDKYA